MHELFFLSVQFMLVWRIYIFYCSPLFGLEFANLNHYCDSRYVIHVMRINAVLLIRKLIESIK